MFTQRSLLGGKPARDKTRGVFPHYVTVGDPIDDQNRPNRKQDEDTDAHNERRQQPEGGLILIQMILAAMLLLNAVVAQLGYEFHYGNQRSRLQNRAVDAVLFSIWSRFSPISRSDLVCGGESIWLPSAGEAALLLSTEGRRTHTRLDHGDGVFWGCCSLQQ